MLKHLLISPLAFLPFWMFQISIHMTAMSDLGKTLIIQSLKASAILLKILFFFKISSTISDIIRVLVFS